MSPFLKSWLFLKRQTTLGEHKGFEDAAFSPHGEVRYYHGTTETPAENMRPMDWNVRNDATNTA